jgi:3-hydroxyisobutyrate dehydrogenase-like beta-hydroxyacid dehydrogenase
VNTPAVAVLGLGKMGSAIAGNIAAAGFTTVLFNRTAATAQRLAGQLGATVAASPREAAESVDVLITMLADDDALDAVYRGENGILAGLRTDAIAVDMGTSGPFAIAALAREVAAAGGFLIDAPVSGSTPAAKAGKLTILAGGEESAIARVRPIFDAVGSTTHHLGPVGMGAAMKLALNLIVHSTGQALAEALVLAELSGIDRHTAYDVFSASAVASPVLSFRRNKFLDPDGAAVTFQTALALKDLRLAMELAGSVGAPAPQAEANIAVLQAMVDAGDGDEDVAAIATYLRRNTRSEPKE